MRNRLFIALIPLLAMTASAQPKTQQTFATPKAATDALIHAASDFDVNRLLGILGPDSKDLIASEDSVSDRNRAQTFAKEAVEKNRVELDPKNKNHGRLMVGKQDWPLPIPLVKVQENWRFDSSVGRDEILKRRIGSNELDVISLCRGYVEAQKQYASEVHDNSRVNQYAQRIISSPGKHDGLAWENADGTWGGPVGKNVAQALEQGYSKNGGPFHGYYFKVLKGQGTAAHLGQLDYLIDGAMIGGFAWVAWPAQYGVTGIKTFIVSYDGVVKEQDLGQHTPTIAQGIERYDPDPSWKSTDDDWEKLPT